MVVVPKFTPDLLVSAPRRGPAVPNHDGTLAIFKQSTHEIGGKTLRGFRVMTIETGETKQLIADDKARDAVWLGHNTNTVLYLSSGDGGYTWIKAVDADNPSTEPSTIDFIEAPVGSLKVKNLRDGSIAFVVAGLADNDGNLYNEKSDNKPHTARVTESWNTRMWDSYTKPQKSSFWYTNLVQEEGDWKLNKPLKNVLSGTKLEAPPNIYDVGAPLDELDISDQGIVFAAVHHNVSNPSKVGLSNIYHLALDSFSQTSTKGPARISIQADIDVQTRTSQGYCSQPRFSPNGSTIAFLRSPFGRSLDKSIWVKHVESQSAIDVFTMVTGKTWNLIPEGFEFTPDGHSLHVQAHDSGRVALYKLELLPGANPRTLFHNGAVSSYHTLHQGTGGSDKLLITSSNLVEPWITQIIDTNLTSESLPWVLNQTTQHVSLGLSSKQVSEVYFESAGDHVVQAWIVKPRDFDASRKKYPLCLLVHGGPNGSWDDAWSTRWNPAVWAEQGYIVVMPNITGSQGFGFDMAEAVKDNWGGRPYDDLVNCLKHIKDMPGIDMENAVAAGGNYGGYMMNWIQGHELGRHFKALVCHDGIFHLPSFLLQTDDLSYFLNDFGGPPFIWSNFDGLERYNPARSDLLRHWKTPMLVVHSDKDYHCPITDGLAAYHTLKALGTPARFLSFPDENHFVLKEENSLEWHRQVFAWINKWSGIAARTDDN